MSAINARPNSTENGYENVNRGCCRKIRNFKLFRRLRCKKKEATASSNDSNAKTTVVHHLITPNIEILDSNVEIPNVRTPVSLRGARKLPIRRHVRSRYTLKSLRPSIAPRDSNRSMTYELSEHVYSDGAFYNEIEDSRDISARRVSHRAHVYDTPDAERRLAAPTNQNSRDEYSQRAMRTLENAVNNDDLRAIPWESAGDPGRYYLRSPTDTMFYTVRSAPTGGAGSDDYYESGGGEADTYAARPGANHIYSQIVRNGAPRPPIRSRSAMLAETPSLPDRPSMSTPHYSSHLHNSSQQIYDELDKYPLPPPQSAGGGGGGGTIVNYCLNSTATPCSSNNNLPITLASNNNLAAATQINKHFNTPCSESSVVHLQKKGLDLNCEGGSGAGLQCTSKIENSTGGENVPDAQGDVPEEHQNADRPTSSDVPPLPFAEVDEEEEDEDQEQESQMEEVPTLSGSAGEGNSAHYEYAEPVDAWYYQRGGNGDGTGTLTSESDSQYTEGGAIRYHVITMRPRLGSDGGRSLARQQDYQGRFGPYSCVHLYINEEAIRAHEDNARHLYNAVNSYRPRIRQHPVQQHIYDEPPFESQRSLPQLQLASTGNLPNVVHHHSAMSPLNESRIGKSGKGSGSHGPASSFLKFFSHLRKSSKSSNKHASEDRGNNPMGLNLATSLSSTHVPPTSPLPVPPLGSPTSVGSSRFAGSWVNSNPSSSSLLPPNPSPGVEPRTCEQPYCDNNNNLYELPEPNLPSRGLPVLNLRHSTIPSQRISQDVMESEHYYSEVQYYENSESNNPTIPATHRSLSHRRIYSEPNPRPTSNRDSLDAGNEDEENLNDDNEDVKSNSSCEATYDRLFERRLPPVDRGEVDMRASCREELPGKLRVDLPSTERENEYTCDYNCNSADQNVMNSLNDTISIRARVSSLASHIYQEIPENNWIPCDDSACSTPRRGRVSMVSVQIQDNETARLAAIKTNGISKPLDERLNTYRSPKDTSGLMSCSSQMSQVDSTMSKVYCLSNQSTHRHTVLTTPRNVDESRSRTNSFVTCRGGVCDSSICSSSDLSSATRLGALTPRYLENCDNCTPRTVANNNSACVSSRTEESSSYTLRPLPCLNSLRPTRPVREKSPSDPNDFL